MVARPPLGLVAKKTLCRPLELEETLGLEAPDAQQSSSKGPPALCVVEDPRTSLNAAERPRSACARNSLPLHVDGIGDRE
eukprot:6505446-Karenia_brevis.AAC.1